MVSIFTNHIGYDSGDTKMQYIAAKEVKHRYLSALSATEPVKPLGKALLSKQGRLIAGEPVITTPCALMK